MQKQPTKSSNLPIAIIGLVLLVAVGGGWWWYSNSKATPTTTTANKSNTNTASKPTADMRQALQNAPAGAQPANALGAPTAAVKIEEFADYQCPTCAAVHKTMKEINSLYSGRIQFVYRNYPLTQIHKNAYDAATAAEAAGLQGKYWAMQDQIFTNQQAWSNSNEARKLFGEYAGKIGLDVAKFQNDMLGTEAKSRVDNDLRRGAAIPINGTPTVFINGQQLTIQQMEVNAMRQIIEAELQKAGGGQTAPPASQAPAPNSAANAAK